MMSVLGKYRKDEERRDDEEEPPTSTKKVDAVPVAVPNKERKSPIMSFSVTSELRSCLQAVRNEKAINLSMWVERKLREAVADEFPDIANTHL
ncbi:MAG: hypothetical protein ACXAEF_00065 [Candidatus Thorarchaeota archaeon]|jgi:hypothetical protein